MKKDTKKQGRERLAKKKAVRTAAKEKREAEALAKREAREREKSERLAAKEEKMRARQDALAAKNWYRQAGVFSRENGSVLEIWQDGKRVGSFDGPTKTQAASDFLKLIHNGSKHRARIQCNADFTEGALTKKGFKLHE